MRGSLKNWRDQLLTPVDGASLAVFRIAVGTLLLIEVICYFAFGMLREYYIEPIVYFSYLPFIKPWAASGMAWHFFALGLAAFLVAIGLFYPLAAWALFFLFTYVFLLDKTNYLNHFYLISLICFLLALMPGHHSFSLDRFRKPLPHMIPFWPILLLRLQVGLVYFFGGIAKLNPDWLRGEPQRYWMSHKSDYFFFGPFLTQEWFIWSITYGGILIDLLVPFMLFTRRLFPLGVLLAVSFHLSNSYLFSIGIFPYFMIGSLILFAHPHRPRQWLQFLHRKLSRSSRTRIFGSTFPSHPLETIPRFIHPLFQPNRRNHVLLLFLSVYLLVQFLLPFRHFLYSNSVHWTEEGHRFSWHMMLRSKRSAIDFFVTDPRTGHKQLIDAREWLTPKQFHKMSTRPDMILQFAHHLADHYEASNGIRPLVHVHAIASLNSRPYQDLIDSTVDLASQKPAIIKPTPWIIPLGRTNQLPRNE